MQTVDVFQPGLRKKRRLAVAFVGWEWIKDKGFGVKLCALCPDFPRAKAEASQGVNQWRVVLITALAKHFPLL